MTNPAHTLRYLALAVSAAVLLVVGAHLCGPAVESGPAAQAAETRTLDYVYWTNYGTGANGKVQRQRADRSGPTTTIASGSTDAYQPRDLVIDGDYAYWTNYTSSGKVQRQLADGTGATTTIASGSTDAYSPRDLVVDGGYAYWTNYHSSVGKVQRKRADGTGAITTIASGTTDAYLPQDLVIDGGYAYWTNYTSSSRYSKVQRRRADGSGRVTTIASGSTATYNPRDLVIDGGYAYWTNYHSSVGKVQRKRANGTGAITTIASGSTDAYNPRDLVVDGGYVYWTNYATGNTGKVQRALKDGTGAITTIASGTTDAYNPRDLVIVGDHAYWTNYATGNTGKVQRARKDGTGSVQTVASGSTDVYNPRDLVIRSETETVAGACITDAGTLAADYASHPWDSGLNGSCPNAFYTFRLPDAADLRLSANSAAIDPVPVLRRGGIDGEVVALTTASNGAATTYIHHAPAGEYTVEMALGAGSAQSSGEFMAKLETQPDLGGCEVNLGTLSSEQLQVFGKHDPSCGDTRKYYVYLEFQASISVSASGVGFTPRIELRPGGASDSATATATHSANPADVYRQVASGSYRINLEAITAEDTYNLTFQAFGLPPPTRTPIPTPTPRFQANVDVRLEPDPRGLPYENNRVYRFRLEGGAGSFPATVRLDNAADFALSASDTLDCSAGSQVADLGQLDAVYLRVCGAPAAGNVSVIKQTDYSLLATYVIAVSGGTPPAPAAVGAPGGYVAPPEDRIRLGVLINAVCQAANQGCDVDLIRNAVGAGGSGLLFFAPTTVARGRASGYSSGIGLALALIGLMVAHLWVGLPIWWAGAGTVAVIFLAGVQVYLKFRRVGS